MMMQGTLLRGRGGFYTVRSEDGTEYVLRAKKKFRRQHISPLVGDDILFTPGTVGDEHGWVEEILPRRSECLRPPVANMSLMCIEIAVQPLPDWLLVDKLLYYARKQGVKTAILINKCDLDQGETAGKARETYRDADTAVLAISALNEQGLQEVKELLKGETACFMGQSGVGKSTLLNSLFKLELETGDISQKIARGKNTTRHAELFSQRQTVSASVAPPAPFVWTYARSEEPQVRPPTPTFSTPAVLMARVMSLEALNRVLTLWARRFSMSDPTMA